jgi:large subunit ribosomal protein L9
MKVLLLKNVPKIGKKDEVVEVQEGFANNALLPKKLAVHATPAVLQALQRKIQNQVTDKAIQHNLLDRAILALDDKKVVLQVRANKQGTLFSKIDPQDIAAFLLQQHRMSVDAAHMIFPKEGIKKIGVYTIGIVDEGFRAELILEVVAR